LEGRFTLGSPNGRPTLEGRFTLGRLKVRPTLGKPGGPRVRYTPLG
jgi:hypothetical protein